MASEFLFGAQYYRPPTPPRTDWERDFRAMASAGFNIVKLWAMWRWHNPREGAYRWDDLDRLMDLCAEYRMRAVINIIVDVAPPWFLEKHPDSRAMTLDGRPLVPSVDVARQIGGSNVVCLHHPAYAPAVDAFIAACVERYRGHPALFVWDLWNEPSLPRKIFNWDDRLDETVCGCVHTRAGFAAWLRGKYGDIETLNERWSRVYEDFSQVEVYNLHATVTDVLDFRTYLMQTLTEELRRRVAVTRARDPEHRVMAHAAISSVLASPIGFGNDDWDLADQVDLYGGSLGGAWREGWTPKRIAAGYEGVPVEVDALRCANRGRELWLSEFHAYCGGAFGNYGEIDVRHVRRWITQFIGLGCNTCVLFWQYRVELLGFEAPAWGITELDGSAGQRYRDVAALGEALRRYGRQIAEARHVPNEVALLYSPDAHIMSWMGRQSGSAADTTQSVRGFYRALYDRSIGCDFVHARHAAEMLARYRVVLVPYSLVMDEQLARALACYVDGGGTLVAEGRLASFRREDGMHCLTVPGYGLDRVFGCREARWESVDGPVAIASAGKRLNGKAYRCVLEPTTGRVIGRFGLRGEPAIVRNRFGAGTAVLIGTCLAQTIPDSQGDAAAAFIAETVLRAGASPKLAVRVSGGTVHADVLAGDGYDVLSFVNVSKTRATVKLARSEMYQTCTDVFRGVSGSSSMLDNLIVAPFDCRLLIAFRR